MLLLTVRPALRQGELSVWPLVQAGMVSSADQRLLLCCDPYHTTNHNILSPTRANQRCPPTANSMRASARRAMVGIALDTPTLYAILTIRQRCDL